MSNGLPSPDNASPQPDQNLSDASNPAEQDAAPLRFPIQRRRYPRFEVQPMYTSLTVRFLECEKFDYEGHAYDISEGGCRFELDRGIEMGTAIALQLTLPTMNNQILGPGRAVFVFGNVVWLEDEDEPGPVRMAVAFTRFVRVGDRERLLAELRTGRYKAAA